MAFIYKLLVKQLYNIHKREGTLFLASYLGKSSLHIFNRYTRGSNSQKGEDLFIDKFFNHKKRGFYIDVGACHPKRLNNTKFFYDKGWHGINIEPNPERINLFYEERKRDVNLNIGIGTVEKMTVFYELGHAGVSTFSKNEADSLIALGHELRKKSKIQILRLENIMKKYVKSPIDFMTVDAEAMDLDVLKSSNWEKYRPKLLCIETIDFIDLLTSTKRNLSRKNSITEYLSKKGYKEIFTNGLNTFYKDEQ